MRSGKEVHAINGHSRRQESRFHFRVVMQNTAHVQYSTVGATIRCATKRKEANVGSENFKFKNTKSKLSDTIPDLWSLFLIEAIYQRQSCRPTCTKSCSSEIGGGQVEVRSPPLLRTHASRRAQSLQRCLCNQQSMQPRDRDSQRPHLTIIATVILSPFSFSLWAVVQKRFSLSTTLNSITIISYHMRYSGS